MSSGKSRIVWGLLAISAMVLAACGGGGGAGPSAPPPPAGNNVVASWSLNGTVQATVGGSQTIGVAFATDDGKAVTSFQVTQNLSALPAGWTSTSASVSCAQVTSGNGCVLLLRYAPTAVASGTLSIAYSYTDSASKARTGTVTIAYGATSHNNVVLTVVPAGRVETAVGGSQSVTIFFTTDDGTTATSLQVTSSLTALPAGWSSPVSTFTCTTVSSGNGCLLNLSYAPTAAASSTLQLGFSYTDNTSSPQMGSITLQYEASTGNHVVATVAPGGQVAGIIGGSQNVSISFKTDDNKAATAMQITGGLGASLPGGWSGPATYSCSSVSTGNGCEFNLTFAPTAVGTGTLYLSYKYTSGAGTAMTGLVTILYSATSDNNVVVIVAPSGSIDTAVMGNVGVDLTFTTDDFNQASNLSVTGGLGTLPSGWTGPTSFTCAGFATGNGCQLNLHYAPTAVESGKSLVLNYSYKSNSGANKAGTVSLPYQSTPQNHLVATASPSGQVTAVVNKGKQVVNVTFTSDDGNPVTAINVTSGLSLLPTDWTGPSTYTCATASMVSICPPLALTFTPLVQSFSSVILGYSYTDNAGKPQTGTIPVPYASIPTYFYANKQTDTVLRCAASFVDGSLSGCASVATGFKTPYGLTFYGNHVYIADSGDTINAIAGNVFVCPVNADGTFGTCVAAAPAATFTTPNAVAALGGYLYVADSDGTHSIQVCAINGSDGTLSNCAITATALTTPLNAPDGIAVVGSKAYIVDYNGGNLTTCDVVTLDGTLTLCTQQAIGLTPGGLAVYQGNLYVGTGDAVGDIKRCRIAPGGSVNVSNCVATGATAGFSRAVGFGFVNGFAYVSGYGGASGNIGGIAYCPMANDATGNFDLCKRGTDNKIKGVNFYGMAAH